MAGGGWEKPPSRRRCCRLRSPPAMEEPPLQQPLPPGEDEEEGEEEEEEEEADAEWSFVDREMEAVALRDLPTATIACNLDPRVFQDGPCRVRRAGSREGGAGRGLPRFSGGEKPWGRMRGEAVAACPARPLGPAGAASRAGLS